MWFGFSNVSHSHKCRSCDPADWNLLEGDMESDEVRPLWKPDKFPKITQALFVVGSDSCVPNSFPEALCAHEEGGDRNGQFPGHLHEECDRQEYFTSVMRLRYANNIFPRYKTNVVHASKDPPIEIFNESLRWLQRESSNGIIFHYAFEERLRGVGSTPAASQFNGSDNILFYDIASRKHIQISIHELYHGVQGPALFIFDCPSGARLLDVFDATAADSCCVRLAISRMSTQHGDHEERLPVMLLTDCLVDPIHVALRYFLWRRRLTWGADDIYAAAWETRTIKGKASNRNTPLGEIMWIFTAIVDAIAWNSFDVVTFTRLFRGDSAIAAMFRNYLFAERMLLCIGGHKTISRPNLEPTARHPLWDTWDYVLEEFLMQQHTNPAVHIPSAFFQRQLAAFAVSLRLTGPTEKNNMQLPILLQMMLHADYRLECLRLLAAYMDLGAWTLLPATVVGIKPYLAKILLQHSEVEVVENLLLIWAKLVAGDPKQQAELLKEDVFSKLVDLLIADWLSAIYRSYACCIIGILCRHHSRVFTQCMSSRLDILSTLFGLLGSDVPELHGMVCFLLSELCARGQEQRDFVMKLQRQPTKHLLAFFSSKDPIVRALATSCVGKILRMLLVHGEVPWDSSTQVNVPPNSIDAIASQAMVFQLAEQFWQSLVVAYKSSEVISELNPLPVYEFLCILSDCRVREFFHTTLPTSPVSSGSATCNPPEDGSASPQKSPAAKPALMSLSVAQALRQNRRDPWRESAELLSSSPDAELNRRTRRMFWESLGTADSEESCSGCQHHLPHVASRVDAPHFDDSRLRPCRASLRRSRSESTVYDMIKRQSDSRLSSGLVPVIGRRLSGAFTVDDLPRSAPTSGVSTPSRLSPRDQGRTSLDEGGEQTAEGTPSKTKSEATSKRESVPPKPTSYIHRYVCRLLQDSGAYGRSLFCIKQQTRSFSRHCVAGCTPTFVPPSAPSPLPQPQDWSEAVTQFEGSRPFVEPGDYGAPEFEFTQIADIGVGELGPSNPRGLFHVHSMLNVALVVGNGMWRVVDYRQMEISDICPTDILDENGITCPWYRPESTSNSSVCSSCGEPQPRINQFLTLHHRSLDNDPHGSLLACARDDGSFHLYRCWGCSDCPLRATGRSYQILPRRRKAALRVGYNPHTQHLLAGGRHSNICVWDLAAECLSGTIDHKSTHCVSALAEMDVSSSVLFFGVADGSVQMIDLRGGPLWTEPKRVHAAPVVACWATNTVVSSVDEKGVLIHLDVRKNGAPMQPPLHIAGGGLDQPVPVFDVAPLGTNGFGPDFEFVTSTVRNGRTQDNSLWFDIAQYPEHRTFEAPLHSEKPMSALAVSLSSFVNQRVLCMLLSGAAGGRLVVYGKS